LQFHPLTNTFDKNWHMWHTYGKAMTYVKTLAKHIRKQPNLPWGWKMWKTKSIWNLKKKKMLFVVQGLKGSEKVPYFLFIALKNWTLNIR
jgi:hypothetical protein